MFGKSKKLKFDYNEPNIGSKIISEYGSDFIASCVTGMSGILQTKRINEFCSHMAAAALQGDSIGVALSCFSQHGSPFNQHLPISLHSMSDEAFELFVELLNNNIVYGFSKSAKQYLLSNRSDVEKKANEKNSYAQWLMGAWYAFDNYEFKDQDACMKERIFWYEKSAFGGYVPAIQAVAELYDNGDDTENLSLPTDLKKSAFWYRYGALKGNSICAYNLGVMYAQDDFVKQDLNVARMWLSLSYKNNADPEFSSHIQKFAKQFSIQLTNSPNLNQDPELDNLTSEFQDAYEESFRNPSGDKFREWLQNNCCGVKFEPQKIETWDDLKTLNLRNNQLSELPDDILILTGLVKLRLCANHFSTVPEVVFKLPELTNLDLSGNQLTKLSHNIAQLKKLKILHLPQNQLTTLPSEIGELTNLTSLSVQDNNLTSLPQEIGKMTALMHISIWGNNLSNLPDEIMNLSNLETIYIEDNNFTEENIKIWVDRLKNTKCKISFA